VPQCIHGTFEIGDFVSHCGLKTIVRSAGHSVQIKIEKEMITKAITKLANGRFFYTWFLFFVLHGFTENFCVHIYGAKNTVLSCCSGIFVRKVFIEYDRESVYVTHRIIKSAIIVIRKIESRIVLKKCLAVRMNYFEIAETSDHFAKLSLHYLLMLALSGQLF
jgi:hypothetical protein